MIFALYKKKYRVRKIWSWMYDRVLVGYIATEVFKRLKLKFPIPPISSHHKLIVVLSLVPTRNFCRSTCVPSDMWRCRPTSLHVAQCLVSVHISSVEPIVSPEEVVLYSAGYIMMNASKNIPQILIGAIYFNKSQH
ncbi:hypothetical protein PYW08_012289 [Mythimna loreyi]|uniref:Uncharacterized protein n=1 Tax=Mythimna loreyi TaxID=667449 RepID=A0ACC2PZR7_9NEOP|nr:hypothetical protein PYW08_012289 [Mythimna loreyi]